MIGDLSIRVASPGATSARCRAATSRRSSSAKGLLTAPKVLLLDEPTRGIDVGAKSEIFEIMSRLATQGYAILFVSSELKEVLAMSDRILVMSKGAVVAEFAGDGPPRRSSWPPRRRVTVRPPLRTRHRPNQQGRPR